MSGGVEWTQVLLAAITTAGSVATAYFARSAHKSRRKAAQSADIAVQASLRPAGGMRPPPLPPE
jgi:hypothetical protein